ncbi:MAG: alcohol dehydrogenase catalytic domain-containing protein, partial [Gammaproteobacteria bacterium]|nr:alcohol dehydrogenase catalytic domain-containing protein [Gammaproteobacteria bacterium]
MKMKGAVLRTPAESRPYVQSKPVQIEELELDPPGPGEVLVKIGGAGICHSDLSVVNGHRARLLPMVLGHEGSGEIVELGSGVNDVAVGDHIVFQFSASCGRCRRCLEGRPQICELAAATKSRGALMSGHHRLRDMDGKEVHHQSGVSCYAEYAVVDRGSVVKIDKSLPLHEAAIFGCAVMTGTGAVINTARIR